eukprot:4255-Heterococcus_DN1.PRE.2
MPPKAGKRKGRGAELTEKALSAGNVDADSASSELPDADLVAQEGGVDAEMLEAIMHDLDAQGSVLK